MLNLSIILKFKRKRLAINNNLPIVLRTVSKNYFRETNTNDENNDLEFNQRKSLHVNEM